jgi:hypothetical protein
MTDEEREKLMAALLKSNKIRGIYETSIIKEIPFDTWVRSMADRLLKGVKHEQSVKKGMCKL